MELSDKAKKIFKMKYAVNKDETWQQACWRIASYVASAESAFGKSQEDIDRTSTEFYQIIEDMYFLPGGRVLANAGTGIKSLMNCFVLPIGDSRDSIYTTLKNAAEVFAHGGGIGYSFSHIREEGSSIQTTGGKASGPLSFMSLFDQTGEVIQQASRRGAQMGMLSISHPDIQKFIDYKAMPNSRNKRLLEEYHRNLKRINEKLKDTKYYNVLEKTLLDDQLTHFNVSVIIPDEFMDKYMNDDTWDLKSVVDDEVVGSISAVDLLKKMAQRAWESGDPGVFFSSRSNEDNMVPYVGNLECTNPCGEVPLLPYEACCLGSLNLHQFYDPSNNSVDYPKLEYVVRLATRFLDDVQEISELPIPEINDVCKGLRRLGLGVFGWADLLAEMGIPYDSVEAFNLGEYLSWFISYFSWLESIGMASERGTFKFYDKDQVDLSVVLKVLNSEYSPAKMPENKLREIGLRNVSVTSIAPTGTIAILADKNSGIEPYFALAYTRNVTEGVGNVAKDVLIEINPILFRKLEEAGLDNEKIEEIKKKVLINGTVQDIEEIPENIRKAFLISNEIHWIDHIKCQEAWQNYVTNAVSKTINCSKDTSVEEVEEIFVQMWLHNLKGGTIYRDGSKLFQILNVGAK